MKSSARQKTTHRQTSYRTPNFFRRFLKYAKNGIISTYEQTQTSQKTQS